MYNEKRIIWSPVEIVSQSQLLAESPAYSEGGEQGPRFFQKHAFQLQTLFTAALIGVFSSV